MSAFRAADAILNSTASVTCDHSFTLYFCSNSIAVSLNCSLTRPKGPSIKNVTLFLAHFDPLDPPVTFCHTSRNPPPKVRHTSLTPIFSRPSTKIPDKSPLYKFYLNCSRRFLSGFFYPGCFLSVPPIGPTIHLLQ